MDRSFRLPRLWSNSVLAEIAPLFDGSVINVSGWDDRDKQGRRYREYFRNSASYSISNHIGERGLADSAGVTDYRIDLEEPLERELIGQFETVFNHTALEHIYDINTAVSNLCRLSSDVVIVVVPFAQELHSTPSYGDYWRFTPMCLRRLFSDNDFTVVFEAANGDRNAGIYLCTVASRHPERWRGKFPVWQPVETLGGWIGATLVRRLKNALGWLRRGVRAGVKKGK